MLVACESTITAMLLIDIVPPSPWSYTPFMVIQSSGIEGNLGENGDNEGKQ
jgi:hypothetical protein